jgi:hypothetical protein
MDAHHRLLPLGTHLVVQPDGIMAEPEISIPQENMLSYLRYPETHMRNLSPYHLFVVMVLKHRNEDMPKPLVVGVQPGLCTIMAQGQRPPNVRPMVT